MKKRSLLSWVFMIAFILAGCGVISTSDSSNNDMSVTDQPLVTTTAPSETGLRNESISEEESTMSRHNPGRPTYPLEETERDFATFLAQIESISADKVTTIRMEYYGGFMSSNHETNNKELIVRWIDLLKKMHFTVRSGPGPDGASAILYVLIDGDETCLGSFVGPDVIISNAAIGRIENYSELAEEFEALEKEMMAL